MFDARTRHSIHRRSIASVLRVLTLLCVTATLADQLPAQAHTGSDVAPPLVVDATWLATQSGNPNVVVLQVEHGDYAEGHIPAARPLTYRHLVVQRNSLGSELPASDSLRALFEGLGISNDSHVIVYAHEAPMATRALLSLAAIGLQRTSLLDGGLVAWRAAGLPQSTSTPAWKRGTLSVSAQPELVVSAPWIEERLGQPGLALLDTRTDGEYNGSGNRSGMPSAGHLAGAHQLEWQELFTDGAVTLKPIPALRALYGALVRDGDTVVTYCWVGYRASATWFVARLLGYDSRLYDGSYQDWMQRALPTTAGSLPE